jgi:hypothetical protein
VLCMRRVCLDETMMHNENVDKTLLEIRLKIVGVYSQYLAISC